MAPKAESSPLPIAGAMQPWPLTVDRMIDHAARWHGDVEIVSREIDGLERTNWRTIRSRACSLSAALAQLDVSAGQRVATLAWNRTRHVECWYAIMGMGAICHTLNPRLHPDQLVWIVNHAQDDILIVDIDLVDVIRAHRAQMPSVRHVIVMGSEGCLIGDELDYESAVVGNKADFDWGGFDENAAAGLCYTSGTTGDPKGVLYSHRSNVLHAVMSTQPDAMALSARDVVMPIVPMFHANAWGLVFSAPAVGAKMVLPGSALDGKSITELMVDESVTLAAGVPTVWQGVAHYLRETGKSLPFLERIVVGGAACPEDIVRYFVEEHDVEVLHAWGMTEMSPVGTIGNLPPPLADWKFEAQLPYRMRQGRVPFGVDIRIADESGRSLPHDGVSTGNLMAKGWAVAEHYYRMEEQPVLDRNGWFDTGDIATIDRYGLMAITDRAKDVIKSGGEWISSIAIENIVAGHPKVAHAAVIGVPHPKWDERPLLLVEGHAGAELDPEEIRDFLDGRIAKWWMPDEVRLVDQIPLGATGKIDKKAIRESLVE